MISILLLAGCASDNQTTCYHNDADSDGLCDYCGEAYTPTTAPDNGEESEDTDPSEGDKGEEDIPCTHEDADGNSLCDICGETLTENEQGHTHTFGEWTETEYSSPISCEAKHYQRVCDECGATETKNGSFSDHILTTVSERSPTCILEGIVTTACENCNYTATETIAALGHSYPDGFETSALKHWKACTVCYESSEHAEHTPDSTNTCTVCGNKMTATNGIIYGISDDCAEVVGYEGDEREVIISDTYEGKSVKRIAKEAFHGSEITRIYIPATVTEIGKGAFGECAYLSKVFIPSSVTEIGEGAFAKCGALTEIDIPDSVTKICSSAFTECVNLSSLNLGAGVLAVGDNAFQFCRLLYTELNSLVYVSSVSNPYAILIYPGDYTRVEYALHEDTEIIAEYAFAGCDSMREITIPKSVRGIGAEAFQACDALESVYIHDLAAWCRITMSTNDSPNTTNPLVFADKLFLIDGDGATLITEPVIPDGVEAIEDYAFFGYKSLRSVSIPKSVKKIGTGAFGGCSSLEGVYAEDLSSWLTIKFESATANPLYFGKHLYLKGASGYTELQDLTIPSSLTSIGDFAFVNCESLESVRLHSGIRAMGEDAFLGCKSLTGVYITEISAWCKINFATKGANPLSSAGLLYIENDKTTELVTELIIPNGTPVLHNYAFYNCKSIQSVAIPEGITSIGASAFYGCESLLTVYISDTRYWLDITFGDQYANPFCCATSLYKTVNDAKEPITSIYVPSDVTKINDYAFYGWEGLTEITFGYGINAIGYCAFGECSGLGSVILPDSVIEIGEYAFINCKSLESVTLGDGVKSIGGYAFAYCRDLLECVTSPVLESIEEHAFEGCSALSYMVIPRSVTYIAAYAFHDCGDIVICCEVDSKPDTWDLNWRTIHESTVIWNYKSEG